MLRKLSLNGIKSRWQDYLVLFSGLVFASAIFYMFMTIATNPTFLKGSLKISFKITQLVFALGIVLLALITFVYLTYANSFLLSMRKKDYGMYMMLGARSSKIGKLIFLETLIVGLLGTLLGVGFSIFLTQWVAQVLISQLGLVIHHFLGFYLPAIFWTLLFFTALFILAAFWNRHKLVKSRVVQLLHEDQKPVKLRRHPLGQVVEAIIGLAFLAAGYWAMSSYAKLMMNSISIAFVTILVGSFLIFNSLFNLIIDFLRQSSHFKYHRLRLFTLGQLKFRVQDYTKILTIVSMLFALALGAITVGLNCNSLTDQALESSYYDVVIYRNNKQVEKKRQKVSVRKETKLNYKLKTNAHKGTTIYLNKKDLDKHPLKAQDFYQKNGQQHYRTITINSQDFLTKNKTKSQNAVFQLTQLIPYPDAQVKLVSSKQYRKLPYAKKQMQLLLVNDFKKNFKNIEQLQTAAVKEMISNPQKQNDGISVNLTNSKIASYRLVLGIASGFEFMGFFLGLAFLAMLASTLMFKVLSGAASDRVRYQMLRKIGTHTSWLQVSLDQEIGILFVLPAVLGIVDVLFGLQFFKSLLANPYDKIWIPFTIFLVIYLLYYLLTVKLYQGIVLKRK